MSEQPTKPPILPPGAEGFRFEWRAAADAELSWEYDGMHFPSALTPMAADYVEVLAQGFAYRYERLEIPMEIPCRIWNGYAYFSARFGVPDADIPAMSERAKDGKRRLYATAATYWNDIAMPELLAIYAEIDAVEVAASGADELVAEWNNAWQRIVRAWQIHFFAIAAPYQVLNDLADRYEALVPGAPPGDALRLIGGHVIDLQEVQRGIERLADLARDDPSAGTWLRAASGDRAGGPAPATFSMALDDFLDRHGHLGQGWDDLTLPSWSEEPRQLFAEVAKQLDHSTRRAADRERQLADEGQRLLDELRQRVAGRGDELAAFEALLEVARQIGPLSETHNYWIDRMAQAHLRRLVMRVAARLVAHGVFGSVDDVFFLHRHEVADLLRTPHDTSNVVALRRGEHTARRAMTPPPYVGMPPEVSDGPADRFDGPMEASSEAEDIRGVGASAGIVRGPARVALSQADFGRIQPGDVIVCPSSNPSWVPLFSIAGGLVTDVGGVLSHAAVVAREFGLPAVVGTRNGTTRIADGRLVEVDGSTGSVRLL